MSWYGPALQADQRDLIEMLDDFEADHRTVLTDDPEAVRRLIGELVELGVWTLGVAEEYGGGGADWPTTAVALVQTSRRWPALGLAAVQSHAAAELLARDGRCADLVARVHAGTSAVAIVDAASVHARVALSGSTLRGAVDRVDAAAEAPYLLVLSGEHTAHLVLPSALSADPLGRTGLGGALTRSLAVQAEGDALITLSGVDVPAARARLRRGVAAVAAGIAAAATDAARTYAAGRHQFGDALTQIPTVRQSLLTQASRTSNILAAVLAAADDDPVRGHAIERAACEGAIEVTAAALQSHGGYGYLTEYPAERYLRDAVSLRAAADIQAAASGAARALVGLSPAEALTQEASV